MKKFLISLLFFLLVPVGVFAAGSAIFLISGNSVSASIHISPTPTPTQIPTPTPEKQCKKENSECQVNNSDKACCAGLVCVPFNENSGNGKCHPAPTSTPTPTPKPTVTPTPTPNPCKWEEDCITPTVTPIPTEEITPTPTPGPCGDERLQALSESILPCVTPTPTQAPEPTPVPHVDSWSPAGVEALPACPNLYPIGPQVTKFQRTSPTDVNIWWTKVDQFVSSYVVYYGPAEDKLVWNTTVNGSEYTELHHLPPNQSIWVSVAETNNGCVGNRGNTIDP